MYSIEYLFIECNLKKRAIGLVLSEPILLEGEPVDEICMLKVKTDEAAEKSLLKAISQGNNTNVGIFPIIVSDKRGDPLNPQTINLNISKIKEVWKR